MHAPLPVAQLLFAVSVVELEHRGGMLRLHESLARLAADALCRRVRSDQLRMLRLNPLELVHQRVELGIRNLRIVQHVIAILVVPYLLAQSFDFLLDGGTGHDWGIIVRGVVPSAAVLLGTGYWVTGNSLLPLRLPNPSATNRAATHARRRLLHPFQQLFKHNRVVMLLVSRRIQQRDLPLAFREMMQLLHPRRTLGACQLFEIAFPKHAPPLR